MGKVSLFIVYFLYKYLQLFAVVILFKLQIIIAMSVERKKNYGI